MAVLELENMRNYVNGLHKLLMSLTKDSATETFTFAKLYVNESDLVVLLNAEVEDFNETGINIEPTDARDNELKVGVSVYDEETYNNAIKAISHTADLYELVASDEFDVDEFVNILSEAVARLREMSPLFKAEGEIKYV